MRIIYFHQHFTTPNGKGGIRSYAMAKRLVDIGHQVTIVTGSNDQGNTGLTSKFQNGIRRGTVEGIQVIELELPYSNTLSLLGRTFVFLKFAMKSARIAMLEPADIIFATTTPLTASIPGILAKLLRRRTFVFEVRDLWPELPKAMGVIRNPLVLWSLVVLEWMSYFCANRLVALSPGIKEGIEKRLLWKKPVCLIPNGCDLDIFQGTDIINWKPDPLLSSKFIALYSGTIGVANGIDALVDAAEELQKMGRTDITIALIGEGKEKPRIQQRIAQLNLKNILTLPSVPKTKLAGLFRSVDVGLQILENVPAFYYGTSPNKFFDYLSAGLPVVTNYPGWVADLITANECGIAAAPKNPRSLAQALCIIADDNERKRKMGANSLALAQREFNRENLSQKFASFVTGA